MNRARAPSPPAGEGWGEGSRDAWPSSHSAPTGEGGATPHPAAARPPSPAGGEGEDVPSLRAKLGQRDVGRETMNRDQAPSPPAGEGWGEGSRDACRPSSHSALAGEGGATPHPAAVRPPSPARGEGEDPPSLRAKLGQRALDAQGADGGRAHDSMGGEAMNRDLTPSPPAGEGWGEGARDACRPSSHSAPTGEGGATPHPAAVRPPSPARGEGEVASPLRAKLGQRARSMRKEPTEAEPTTTWDVKR
ncbi:hypothetical protein FG93_05368 [Bosea sp. LC85]|nr:hypothetical protein FG93_05368 [Bosea sp. LC85]